MDLRQYRAFIEALTEASGRVIRPLFGSHAVAVELKSDETPVTLADRGAEEAMRALIRRHFPAHGIVGEEFGEERTDAEFVWVLDPIDGTKSFTTACPLFGTLVALMHRGEPVLGAIHQPILGQLVVGDGTTTTLNGAPVRVRARRPIAEATLLTSDPLNPAKLKSAAGWAALSQRARLVRTWGDCYGYLLLVSGWADIMCDPIMNLWDLAALIPIVRGAGGTVTDWEGGDPVRASSTLATTSPELHAEVLRTLNPA